MRTIVAALLALAAPAAADDLPTIDDAFPPAIRVEPGTSAAHIARISVDPQPGVSWISFDVADRFSSRTRLLIDVPAGTRIVGMAVTSHDVRMWSALRRRGDASERANDEPESALLAWDGTSADEDHIHIDVDANSRVELAVLFPRLHALAIARGARLDVDLPAAEAPADYPHVTADLWLVAGAPDRPDEREPLEHRFAAAPYAGGKKGIRRGFRANRERITHCYERATQYGGPRVEGTVALQFLLGTDGKVQTVASASDLPPDVTGCIEDVIAAWQFDAQDTPTIVNYPLTFRPSE